MSFTTPSPVPKELTTGCHVTAHLNHITVHFDDIKYALSTSPLNGGFHHVLAVRNQQLAFKVETEEELPGGSLSAYLASEFEQIDTPVHFSTAIITAASMEHHYYSKVQQGDCIVEAIITAGVDQTAHRAGDGYLYEEHQGHFASTLPTSSATASNRIGTINMLIFTNKALGDGAMTRAMITIAEAKAAALADMGIYSVYGKHNPNFKKDSIATGSATDGVILTIDTNGDILSDAGTFSLFGDTLAKAVREGVKQALITSEL